MEIKEKIIEEPYGFIYITTNMVNGMKYLGRRKFYNDNSWHRYLGSGVVFRRALKKYGKENFSRNIICFCYSEDELNKTEYNLSVFLDVVENNDWYNLVYGGGATNGYHHSESTKQKLSLVQSNPSEETRKKMSESAKARCTEEWRQWLSNRNRGKWLGYNNPNYGNNNWSGDDNPRHKIPLYGKDNPNYGNHKLAGKNNPRAKPIVQLTKNNQFIREWDYITEASDSFGVKPWNIVSCCTHKLKSAYGFHWLYKEEYDQLVNNSNNDLTNKSSCDNITEQND